MSVFPSPSDIVTRLRALEMNAADEAAELIQRLTAERDEARREALMWLRERCSASELTQEIKQRGWEYLKEDGK